MTTSQTVELRAQGICFFSQLDEGTFFAWLGKLPCFSNVEGNGDLLFIRVIESKVDEYALRELLALFQRYGIDMKQLDVFDKREFEHWFHKSDAYWYEPVFGS